MKKKVVHICVLNRNVGDNALNLAIHQMLRPIFRLRRMELLGNRFKEDKLEALRQADLIIVGGGGLIHSYGPRGDPWQRTGTMWNIALEELGKLRAHIVLYAVGFNHFYGEPGPLPAVCDFFRLLVEKNATISFRNDGSKERFLQHFPEFDQHIREVPDPGVFFRPRPRRTRRPYVVLQIAADRQHLRYGDRREQFLDFVAELCRRITEEVLLIPHTIDDHCLYASLRERLPVRVLPFHKHWLWAARNVGYYAGAKFTISTRGHSQICSVGNGVPTFSIATHPKINGFAKSCEMEEWCFDFRAEPVDAGLARFERFTAELAAIREKLADTNRRFDQQIRSFNEMLREL